MTTATTTTATIAGRTPTAMIIPARRGRAIAIEEGAMSQRKNKRVAGLLLMVFACASVGCAGSHVMDHPTRETFTTYLRDGDSVEVVLKSGEKRRVVVAKMDEGAVWGASGGAIAYADMASVRVVGRVRKGDDGATGTTHEWRRAGAVVLEVCAEIPKAVGYLVLCVLKGYAESARIGAGRHW